MLVVSGVIVLGEEGREQAIEAAKQMAVATRSEEGCLTYSFYVDVEDPSRVRVFEEWQSEEALAAHFQAPHMAAFRQALSQVDIRSRSVKKYTVEDVVDL